MVVDDELDSLTVVARMFEISGYTVHSFSDPQLALAHIKDCDQCSIVLSDIKMPSMTGLELAKHLKRIRPLLHILLMTGFPIRKEEWQKVLPTEDADDFIKKPFTMAQLSEVMRRYDKQLTNHSKAE